MITLEINHSLGNRSFVTYTEEPSDHFLLHVYSSAREVTVRPVNEPKRVRLVTRTRTSSRMGTSVREHSLHIYEVPVGVFRIIIDNAPYVLELTPIDVVVVEQPRAHTWIVNEDQVLSQSAPFSIGHPPGAWVPKPKPTGTEPDPDDPEPRTMWERLLDD